MLVMDVIAEILKREGISTLFCFPTTPIIEAAAAVGIKPVICRQERVGVHMADGFARVSNGRPPGVFAMQYGPGAENAFAGVATAFSDSSPVVFLPLGHPRETAQLFPMFKSSRTYASITKSVEEVILPEHIANVMRRAFAQVKNGRQGPVMVEVPADVHSIDVSVDPSEYRQVPVTRSAGDERDIDEAARMLLDAACPMILAGQGVFYGEATEELRRLAELMQAPVMTTFDGKSAFPEDHALALGPGGGTFTGHGRHFLHKSDLVLGVGCSFTKHGIATPALPPGKKIIHATNDTRDLHKAFAADLGILGDAKLVLGQLIEALGDRLNGKARPDAVAQEVAGKREEWLARWQGKLRSDERPINPYRVISEFMRVVDPAEAIVTHDFGEPARAAQPVLPGDPAARIYRLGQIAPARHRARVGDRGEGRCTRQILRQLYGRRGVRHDRPRFRDRGALRDPDPDDRLEQLDDGDRDPCDGAVARTLPGARPRRQLREHCPRPRRLERARRGPGADRRRDPARPPPDRRRARRAARIHHQPRAGFLPPPRRRRVGSRRDRAQQGG